MARKKALQERKEKKLEPVKIKDPQLISVGKLYLGNQDRDNLVAHCKTPHEVLVARSIDRYIPIMRHKRDEDIVPSHFSDKKRARGVLRYAVYEFQAEIIEKGEWTTKRVELKCEVRSTDGHKLCEYPYALRIL